MFGTWAWKRGAGEAGGVEGSEDAGECGWEDEREFGGGGSGFGCRDGDVVGLELPEGLVLVEGM